MNTLRVQIGIALCLVAWYLAFGLSPTAHAQARSEWAKPVLLSGDVLDVAEALIDHLGVTVEPEIACKSRAGGLRHCFTDISRIRALGYRSAVAFGDGIAKLVDWVRSQAAVDGFEQARRELLSRDLAV